MHLALAVAKVALLSRVAFARVPFPTKAVFPANNQTNLLNNGTATSVTTDTIDPTSIATTPIIQTLPSGVSANIGYYSLPLKPAQCTGDVVPFQTGFWVNSNQMMVEDDGNWWNSVEPIGWTFSTNDTGVAFSDPAFPGASGQDGISIKPNFTTRSSGNSLTINMVQQDSPWQLFISVYNASEANSTVWNTTNKRRDAGPEVQTFFINITGSSPCSHPIGNSSCQANTIQRTPDQWSAYGVDQFLSDWIKNSSGSFAPTGMIQKFVEDFNIGSRKACTFTGSCQLIDVCSDLPNSGKDANSPQIYLSLIALQNLSDLFNRIWQSLNIGETDTMTQIAQMAMQFHRLNGTATATNPTPWSLASGSLGIVSGFLGLIPGLETAGGISGLIGGIFGMVNTATSGTNNYTLPDSQYAANEANISQYLGDYVQSTRSSLEKTYTSIFHDGVNVTNLLQGGSTINRTALNLDCSDCESKQEGWTEQYLSLKIINHLMWLQNTFITFMPYGTVLQVDTYKNTSFTESDCASNFLTTEDDKLLTICHTDDFGWGDYLGPGMARLNWYWPGDPDTVKVDENGYGKLNISRGPPGYNSSNAFLNTTGTSQYKLAATDVIESSLRGWIKGGFAYDGVANAAQQAFSGFQDAANQAAQDLFNMDARSAGMFSIPVCVLNDLNRWPTFWSSSDNRVGGDYYSPCQGSLDLHGKKFEDYVSPDLRTILTTSFNADGTTGPVGPGQILGGEGGQAS